MQTALNLDERPRRRFDSDADRWDAVVRRDPAADGQFFYSVRTTGVYCRPSCASRGAKCENVAFHASALAAERAGFRPCKRCRPNEPALRDRQADAIARACRLIEEAEATPSLASLAKAAGMSRFHFHRLFRAETGVTPKAYADAHRAQRLAGELKRSGTVTEAIYGAGFNSNSRFYETSTERLGMTPTAFRKGGVGATIRFAIARSSLGSILVAATDRGVCAISIGNKPDELLRDLEDTFPKAQLIGGDDGFDALVAKVVGFIEAPRRGLDLPLDIRGTAFQEQVWQALRDIPPGETRTYAEIAERIGQPQAVRAVAQACASNRVAVAIPCHRVIRKDGTFSGYRWGEERKRMLIAREALV